MATNVFFNHAVPQEQNLYEDLVVESLRMYGHDVLYLPREIIEEDNILNEDISSKFAESYTIEMYLENVEGTADAGDLMSKFGVYVQEEATFIASARSWVRFVSSSSNLVTNLRPNEGDLIYFPMSGALFEIKYVQDDNPFYQLGKLFVFKMRCTLFEYSGEDFDTSTDADLVELDQGYTETYQLSSITGSFEYGENILLGANVVAECLGFVYNDDTGLYDIVLRAVTSTLSVGDTLTGETSGATGIISVASDKLDIDDGVSQNKDFETNGSNYLDFSETNPFGEVS